MAKDIEIGVKTDREAISSFKQELKLAVGEAQILAAELAKLNEIDAPTEQIQAVESALQAATQKASNFKDSIDDANERIGVMTAGSGFERMSNSLGDIGGKIASLDFGGAAESASRLVTISKTITFKEATSGLNNLGTTFLNIGKALLTNPLFLLAAAIAGIVAAIVALMDKMGVLKMLTDAVGKVFEWFGDIVEALSDALIKLVDSITGSNFAMQKLAADTLAKQDEIAEKSKAISDRKITNIDKEIALAQAQGKDTEKLERKRLQILKDNAREEAKLAYRKLALAKMSGDASEEEIAKLTRLAVATRQAYVDAGKDIQIFNEKQKTEDKEKAKQDAAERAAIAKQKKDEREREAKEQLALARQTEDILLSIKKDGEAKEIDIATVKFDRLIADNKKNKELVKALELQKQNELDGIKDKYDQKEIDKEKAFRAQLAEVRKGAEGLTEVEKLELERQEKIAKLREMAGEEKDLSVELRKEYLDAIAQIDADYAAKTKEVQDKAAEEKKKKDKELADNEKALALEKIENAKNERDAKISIASDTVNGLTAIGNAFIKDQKKLEQFNKASALVQIGIDTARAISALVAASQANPLNATTAGIAGAAQFASGIVQIITNIAKAKQILSGGGSTTPSGGGGGGGNDNVVPSVSSSNNITSSGGATPSFNLFGTAGNFNTNSNNSNNSTTQSNKMNISISVDEINRVQGNVARIEESSTL